MSVHVKFIIQLFLSSFRRVQFYLYYLTGWVYVFKVLFLLFFFVLVAATLFLFLPAFLIHLEGSYRQMINCCKIYKHLYFSSGYKEKPSCLLMWWISSTTIQNGISKTDIFDLWLCSRHQADTSQNVYTYCFQGHGHNGEIIHVSLITCPPNHKLIIKYFLCTKSIYNDSKSIKLET